MKIKHCLLVCFVFALSSVHGQNTKWTGYKCSVSSQQLYDRSLPNIDTCADYCRSPLVAWHIGRCEINNGYGECLCGLCAFRPGKPVLSLTTCP